MNPLDRLEAWHDRLREAGGVIGRLLFGVRLPLAYPLLAVIIVLAVCWVPASEPPPRSVPEAPPVETEVEVVPRVFEAPAMPEPLENTPLPESVIQPASEPLPSPSPAAPAATGGGGNADWLLSLPPEGYTLQLLGSRYEKTLRAFVRRHGLESMTAYYRTRHKGGEWFVLLYGLYTDRDEASVAVGTLPPAVRKNAPFPRTIQSVQKAIREGR